METLCIPFFPLGVLGVVEFGGSAWVSIMDKSAFFGGA